MPGFRPFLKFGASASDPYANGSRRPAGVGPRHKSQYCWISFVLRRDQRRLYSNLCNRNFHFHSGFQFGSGNDLLFCSDGIRYFWCSESSLKRGFLYSQFDTYAVSNTKRRCRPDGQPFAGIDLKFVHDYVSNGTPETPPLTSATRSGTAESTAAGSTS